MEDLLHCLLFPVIDANSQDMLRVDFIEALHFIVCLVNALAIEKVAIVYRLQLSECHHVGSDGSLKILVSGRIVCLFVV